jgi:hypothetical protein
VPPTPRTSPRSARWAPAGHLAEILANEVKQSVTLHDLAGEYDLKALESIVLDFDAQGRLVGIEVADPTDSVLRPELLSEQRPNSPPATGRGSPLT